MNPQWPWRCWTRSGPRYWQLSANRVHPPRLPMRSVSRARRSTITCARWSVSTFVRLVEERPRRGLTDRVMVASARSYVLAPAVLGESAADPARTDRLSTGYLIAIAARMVGEVAHLAHRAERARKPLTTLAIDTEIRFASVADRAAFTAELSGVVTSLAARYHDESSPGGRWHRLVVGAHPRPAAGAPRKD